jgi:hypothetical protein
VRKFIALVIVVYVLSLAQPAKSFWGFKKLFGDKNKHTKTVRIINHPEVPVEITSANVSDQGSEKFNSLTGIYNNFEVKVKNISNKDVMAYRVAWTLKLPFQSWVDERTELNSIEVLGPGEEQVLSFRKDRHYRDDAYYYVEIARAQFADDEIWEAPEMEATATRLDKVQEEINSIEEKSVEDMSIEEIKQQMQQAANGTELVK